MHLFNLFIIILCYQLVPSEAQTLYAHCKDHNNNKGQCLVDKNCSSFNKKQKNEKFVKCDYNFHSQIVCCPKVVKNVKSTVTKFSRKSKELCLKYSQFNFENKRYHRSKTNYPTCGFQTRKYIIDGTSANYYEFPHMALITTKYSIIRKICGGALISDRFILTAAHCVYNVNAKKYEVHLGQMLGINNNMKEKRVNIYDVKKIILPDNYSFLYKYNDIALLELTKKVTFSKFIHPACLPEEKTDEISTPKVILAGYGHTKLGAEDFAQRLQKVTLNVQNIDVCKSVYEKGFQIPEGLNETTQLCVADGDNKDACTGDSGSALQIYNLQFCTYTIVGIVSYGKQCGRYPSITTHIYPYKEWIESIIYNNENINIKNKSKKLKKLNHKLRKSFRN